MNENNSQTRSDDENAYCEFLKDHADQMLLENSSDSIDEMLTTLVEAGFVSETGEIIQ